MVGAVTVPWAERCRLFGVPGTLSLVVVVLCSGYVGAEERTGRTGVTAGAITAPPFEYVYGEDNHLTGTVVVTEDRHLRVINSDGQAVHEVRTGIRFPRAVYADQSGVIHIIGPAEEHYLVGYDGGTMRLTTARKPDHGAVPAVHPRATEIFPDRNGNIYSLSLPGLISYGSAGGYRLWERSLPSTIRDHVYDGAVLFVGLADGSVFGFFPDGEGELLLRVPEGIVSMVVFDSSLWVFTENEAVYRLSSGTGVRHRRESLRVEWSGRSDQVPPPLRFFRADGVRKVVFAEFPGRPASFSSVRLEETSRIVVADAHGHDRMTIQPPHPVRAITPLPRQNALFIEYTDWRFTVISLEGFEDVPSSSSVRSGTSRNGPVLPEEVIQRSSPSSGGTAGVAGTGALAALAEATLHSGSVADRRTLLESIRRRMERLGMYGNVTTTRSILTALVRESVSVPAGVNAPNIRAEAIVILGRLGDRPSRAILSDVVRYDPVIELSAAALVEATAGGRDDSRAIMWGLQRFHRASAADRATIASALLQAVSRVVPDGQGSDSDLHREVPAVIAAAELPRELRRRALLIGRGR